MTKAVLRQRGLGLLGGTFDPVHTGHLALAKAARESFGLMRIDFLPSGAPWQKGFVTAAKHRLAMLELALEGESGFRVNPLELERSGATYTIDTLKALRRQLGSGIPLAFIIGSDQWANFHTWKAWQKTTDYVNIAVCLRGRAPADIGADSPADVLGRHLLDMAFVEVAQWAESKLREAEKLMDSPCGGISFFNMTAHLASAASIRKTLDRYCFADAMRRLDGWLPLPVALYISEHALYGSSNIC